MIITAIRTNNTNNNSSSSTIIITNMIVGTAGGGMPLVVVGADDDNIAAADHKTLTVATDAGAGGGGDAFDEAVRSVVETTAMSLFRRDVARPDRDKRAHANGRAGAHVEALRHRGAWVVEHEVWRCGDRRRRQRRRHGAGQQQDGSRGGEHQRQPSRFQAAGEALWGRLWGLAAFHPKENPLEINVPWTPL